MTKKTTETQEEVVETAVETTEAPAANLTINDLNSLKVIIDIASSRGAFKPNEMVAVGQTYTKLNAFLEQVAKQQAEAQQGE